MADQQLDVNLRDLFKDRALLDRTVRAIALEQDSPYLEALEKLHSGTDSAYNSNRRPTLRFALECAAVDAEYVGEAMGLLFRRDQAVQQAFERSAGPVMLDQMQDGLQEAPGGFQSRSIGAALPHVPIRRRLERIAPEDAGPAIADPAVQETRLARMRAVEPSRLYDGEEGRARFLKEDRIHLDSGMDMVRTAERDAALAGEMRTARGAAHRVAQQLDASIAEAADKRHRLKLLDAKLAELGDTTPGASFEGARDELRSRVKSAGTEPLKLLDQLDAVEAVKDKRATDGDVSTDAARLEALRLTQTLDEFCRTLDAYIAGEPLPEPAPPAPAVQDAEAEQLLRAGLHPGSHELNQRVRRRMRELDASESDYPKVLEQVLEEGP